MPKIYVNDPDFSIPYKGTIISPQRSKSDIDAVLARWGVKDAGWRWDPENNDVFVTFQVKEIIKGREVAPIIRVEPPRIWNKTSQRGKHRRDTINWKVSMRGMYWYIKTHLEQAYLTQSSKTTEFLPHIVIPKLEDKTLKDILVPDIDRQVNALPKIEKLSMVEGE